jgi:hypothetical protein
MDGQVFVEKCVAMPKTLQQDVAEVLEGGIVTKDDELPELPEKELDE